MSGRRNGVTQLSALALVVALLTVAVALWPGGESSASGREPVAVTIVIEHSRFRPDRIDVKRGTLVTFTIVNRDPIDHEFIVGSEGVHRSHSTGSEPAHVPVPGEMTVDAGEEAITTFRFPAAGDVLFACHLPGHLAYGMKGLVSVR